MGRKKRAYAIDSDEMKKWKHKFQALMPPDQLMELYSQLRNKICLEEMYNRGGFNFLQEAYVAGMFGRQIGAKSVRLIPEHCNMCDCEIVVKGVKRRYEITEIMRNGRKRGDEYRDISKYGSKDTTEEEMKRNFATSMCQLRCSIIKKSRMGYDNSVGLIVYFNVSTFGDDKMLVDGITKVLENVDYEFPTIDVLNSVDLFRFTKRCDGQVVYKKFGDDGS